MSRYENLALYVKACERTPFEWGRHDCCTFAAEAVAVQTGADPMGAMRDLYTDEASAQAVIDNAGGMRELVSSLLGEPIRSTFAQRGDVVLFESGNGPAIGICLGPKFAAVNAEGVGQYPMRHVTAAWRVA